MREDGPAFRPAGRSRALAELSAVERLNHGLRPASGRIRGIAKLRFQVRSPARIKPAYSQAAIRISQALARVG